MQIKDHLLKGDKINFVKTPNHSGEFKAGDLDTIILHYTAGPASIAINTLINPRAKASAHLVVDRDGSITQLAPFHFMTWHAGNSSYQGRSGFNKYSIGIEIANDGYLTPSGNLYRAWYGATHTAEEVVYATHRNQTSPTYWHVYSEDQIRVVTELCRLLIEEYNVQLILGHEEIAPARKFDPGPAFPLDKLRDQLLYSRRDLDGDEESVTQMKVAVNKLNIRNAPNTSGVLVSSPLTKGHKVRVLEKQQDWVKVATEIEGWVFASYLEPDK